TLWLFYFYGYFPPILFGVCFHLLKMSNGQMNLFIMVLFFIVCSVCGSFYNVIGIRLPKSTSFLLGRSFCFTCKRTLSWYELISMISFILQRGKCRQCEGKILRIYPVG